jgi:hypothetical protein
VLYIQLSGYEITLEDWSISKKNSDYEQLMENREILLKQLGRNEVELYEQ